MIVAVPSKNRAGRTTTQKILPEATFYVPESEVHQYDYINNVVAVPKEVQGITKTRNWILKNTKDPRVVFIDDDVKTCGYTRLFSDSAKVKTIRDQEFWFNEFEKLFDTAIDMNYKIWGIKTESALRSVYPYKPFIFKTYITASCMGIVNDGEYYFDESFPVKEDYEICLRHIVDKGGILGAKYIHWQNEHWETEGGCKDYRTIEIERQAIKKLARMYPGLIRSAKRKANQFTVQLQF